MKKETNDILNELLTRYPILETNKDDILKAYEILLNMYKNDGILYVCGNGGSMSDSVHIVGELVKCFTKKRDINATLKESLKEFNEVGEYCINNLEGGLRAHSLCTEAALISAYANDREPSMIYAQQLSVYGRKGDTVILISTSGNAKNCYYAGVVAKSIGMNVILLSGKEGGIIKSISDCSIVVKEKETFKIQELHLPIYHALCAMLENELF